MCKVEGYAARSLFSLTLSLEKFHKKIQIIMNYKLLLNDFSTAFDDPLNKETKIKIIKKDQEKLLHQGNII